MAAANPRSQKMQNLPLACVETILKFTPTSKLVRLCSVAVPLPGAFWNDGLKSVLEKRLPLSLCDDLPSWTGYPYTPKVLLDITGARLAVVKRLHSFRFSPLRELIESATLTVRLRPLSSDDPLQSYEVHVDALLSHLPNVVHLALIVHGINAPSLSEGQDLLERCLKHLLPRLASFQVSIAHACRDMSASRKVDDAFLNFIDEARINEMSRLWRLVLPETVFDCLMRTTDNQSTQLQAVLAGLLSLGIQRCAIVPAYIGPAALSFVSESCGQLSQLTVVVRGEFRAYIAAFHALPCLSSLGLDVRQADLTGLVTDESTVLLSISDLRLVFPIVGYRTQLNPSMFKIPAFFPNAKTVALDCCEPDPLELAKLLICERQLFPAVAKLCCFYFTPIFSCPNELFTQFLNNPHLPEAVDFSQIIFEQLARDANLLTAIFCAMQASSIKSLLLRGPVHREGLPRLQRHIDVNEENAKVSAWKDRDLGEQRDIRKPDPYRRLLTEISQQTDFQIIGLKTSGNMKGDGFTIRVFHLLAKRVNIFD